MNALTSDGLTSRFALATIKSLLVVLPLMLSLIIKSLTRFINLLAAGQSPPEIRPFL